jgi:predicted small secreted protein
MKKFVATLSVIMVIFAVAACSNTMNGAGKDMENMGQWVQNKTNR